MMRITGGKQRGWRGRVAAVLAAGLYLVACSSSVGPTEPSGAQTTSEIEYQLFQLANRERQAAAARPSLVLGQDLSAIARQYSEQMRDQGFFSHVAPDGTTLKLRLEIAGVDYSSAGENIAQVSNAGNPAALAHELLMDSRRHRANILDPDFREVGIGVARSSNTFWITQVFVSR